MKKDIEWLKAEVQKRIDKLPRTYIGMYTEGSRDAYHLVLQDINQLDEPEVLSQELPVIPKYVAEYLEFAKDKVKLMKVLEEACTRDELHEWKKEYDWISENDETFARAWLYGYEAEEEPLYHALVKGHELVDIDGTYWIYDKTDDSVLISKLYTPSSYFLTEMSKSEWNKLGINESNADLVEVKEVGE